MFGSATDSDERIFDVLPSVTLQKTFKVSAANADEARAEIERRWTTGKGGAIACGDMDVVDVQMEFIGESV